MAAAPRVWVGPADHDDLSAAIRAGGGEPVGLRYAEAIVWAGDAPEELRAALSPAIRWVQLCAAGVEQWLDAGVIDGRRAWTSAVGVAAGPIAEHAVCLMLAAARDLPHRITATSWGPGGGRQLAGTTAGIVGCGHIGTALIGLLAPFGVRTVALTRTGRTITGATFSLGPLGLARLLTASDWVIVTAPATPATIRLIGGPELAMMRPGAWLVNVSRGQIVDTSALLTALAEGWIGGAALDVTEPEPLPAGHPLWHEPNVIITPHVATTPSMHGAALEHRIRDNVARLRAGRDLIGLIDLDRGY